MGFGLDAHSMLETTNGAVRFSTADSLEEFMAGTPLNRTLVSAQAALEETFFLGLRLTHGVNLKAVGMRLGVDVERVFGDVFCELQSSGMVVRAGDTVSLTPKGRLLSNEAFERFVGAAVT